MLLRSSLLSLVLLQLVWPLEGKGGGLGREVFKQISKHAPEAISGVSEFITSLTGGSGADDSSGAPPTNRAARTAPNVHSTLPRFLNIGVGCW